MDGRLPAIEQRYQELESLSAARRQALEGALALYRMFSEADACQLWVEEKEQWLDGMEIPTKLEDLEVVQQRSVCGDEGRDDNAFCFNSSQFAKICLLKVKL